MVQTSPATPSTTSMPRRGLSLRQLPTDSEHPVTHVLSGRPAADPALAALPAT
ncbi:MAG: hypothetical protein JO259_00480 [Mycobacterium sp.]|nr:hypothetical protein [Mycobacterium sp.]